MVELYLISILEKLLTIKIGYLNRLINGVIAKTQFKEEMEQTKERMRSELRLD